MKKLLSGVVLVFSGLLSINAGASCGQMNGFYTTHLGATAAVLTHIYNDIALVSVSNSREPSLLSKCTGVEEITVPFGDECCKGTWDAETGVIRWSNGVVWRKWPVR
jgi:hypothetical protein